MKLLTSKYFVNYIQNLVNFNEKTRLFLKSSKSLDFVYLKESYETIIN